KPVPKLDPEALELLMRHPFHGNVRELRTYLFDAVARCAGSEISEALITERLAGAAPPPPEAARDTAESGALERIFGRFPTLAELGEYAVAQALSASGNNQSQAARLLGISKQALNKRLKKR
ncbi:MAG TPA: helix-turn-helix domain-containing protein, partial [Desulfuromonadales bacterium]|nr:helix-turn-helix domain-containing protein [Desulfuromonadales bacterium]